PHVVVAAERENFTALIPEAHVRLGGEMEVVLLTAAVDELVEPLAIGRKEATVGLLGAVEIIGASARIGEFERVVERHVDAVDVAEPLIEGVFVLDLRRRETTGHLPGDALDHAILDLP